MVSSGHAQPTSLETGGPAPSHALSGTLACRSDIQPGLPGQQPGAGPRPPCPTPALTAGSRDCMFWLESAMVAR